MNKRIATIAAFAALTLPVLACGAGSTSDDTTEAPRAATTVVIGQPLNYERTVITTKTAATITVANPRVVKAPNDVQVPQRGQWLVVDVTIEVTEGKMLVDGSSFKVVGADGTAYGSELVSVAKPALPFAEIPSGQKTNGTVTFDTAKGAEKGGRIALKDVLASSDAGYWTL